MTEPYYRADLAKVHHLGFGFHADACAPGILALLAPMRGGLVLEIGCGSGLLTRHLALNYLPDLVAVERAVGAIAAALAPGGRLAVDLCDVDWNTARDHTRPLVREGEDWTIISRFATPAPDAFIREIRPAGTTYDFGPRTGFRQPARQRLDQGSRIAARPGEATGTGEQNAQRGFTGAGQRGEVLRPADPRL